MGILVRESPPLRLHALVKTPRGRSYRWGGDEPQPENVPNALTFTTTMPGGFEQCNITLPRKPGLEYRDLEELADLLIIGAGGRIAWEGRIETGPETWGDQIAITPGAVGWQAHLDDNQTVQEIYVDMDSSRFGDMPLNRQIAIASFFTTGDFSWATQGGGLLCALPNQAVGGNSLAETWYTAPAGVKVARVGYIGTDTGLPAGWQTPEMISTDSDSMGSPTLDGLTLDGTLRSQDSSAPGRYLVLSMYSDGSPATPAAGAQRLFQRTAVYGDNGIATWPIDASTPNGVLASDVVAHAVGKYAPLLTFTTGPDGTIQPTSFVIPHLIFVALPGLTSDVVKGAAQFELPDWAVWENRTFWMNPRGDRGRKWRARVGPAQLQQTGPQVERVWNSIVVQWTDVDGTLRAAGPPGSGCDVEDSSLLDPDPENPANQIPGLARRDALAMGIGTADAAIKTGSVFLQEQKLLDTSGQASHIGPVEDEHGVLWPSWMMRGGDQVAYIDASDPSYRRIVSTSYDDSSKANAVNLDSPPDGMAALLERMNVELVRLGLGS